MRKDHTDFNISNYFSNTNPSSYLLTGIFILDRKRRMHCALCRICHQPAEGASEVLVQV